MELFREERIQLEFIQNYAKAFGYKADINGRLDVDEVEVVDADGNVKALIVLGMDNFVEVAESLIHM